MNMKEQMHPWNPDSRPHSDWQHVLKSKCGLHF